MPRREIAICCQQNICREIKWGEEQKKVPSLEIQATPNLIKCLIKLKG